MTQYPSPYSPPPPPDFSAYRPTDPLARAKRAGVLMFVLGGLGLLFGLCVGLAVLTVPMEQLIAPQGAAIPDPPPEVHMTKAELVRLGFIVISVLALAVSAAYVVLGFFVRRGGRGASVTAAVLTGLLLVFMLLNLASLLTNVPGPVELAFGLVMHLLVLGLFGLLMVWLVQAIKSSLDAAANPQHVQAQQWWQYQQQQLAYGQPPAGYGPPGGYSRPAPYGYGYGGYGQAPVQGGYGYGGHPPAPSAPSSNLPQSPDSGGGAPAWDAATTPPQGRPAPPHVFEGTESTGPSESLPSRERGEPPPQG